MHSAETLLRQLVQYPSLTPTDAGCQDFIANYLTRCGFTCTRYNSPPVSNLYAERGTEGPLLLFAGHTDVVPVGEIAAWHTPPFELVEKDGFWYGRGVADMKGGLVAMLLMAERLAKTTLPGRIGFLITSGEEGDVFQQGTPFVMEKLKQQGICPTYCIVGEPSSDQQVGDTIKIGRRGSFTARITLHGQQGHVAYPHLAVNPIHQLAPALLELSKSVLDQGTPHFPPSSLQIVQITAGGEATNLIPGDVTLTLNIRYSPEHTADSLQQHIAACFQKHKLTPTYHWQHSGIPFLTETGRLLTTCCEVIQSTIGHPPILSTSGGTSDGRFIAPYGVEVIELGLCNATIHQVNECIRVDEIDALAHLYEQITRQIFQPA